MSTKIVKAAGVWFLAFALFGAHLFFRSVAHADTDTGPKWKQVYATGGECIIDFPANPEMVQQSIPLADGAHQLNYDIYLAPFEDRGVLLLLIAKYPASLNKGHEAAGLEGLVSGILSHHPENKLVFSEMTTLFDQPAMNFLIEGGSNYFRGQAMMAGNKLYLLAMEGRKGEFEDQVFVRFLKSFNLLLH